MDLPALMANLGILAAVEGHYQEAGTWFIKALERFRRNELARSTSEYNQCSSYVFAGEQDRRETR